MDPVCRKWVRLELPRYFGVCGTDATGAERGTVDLGPLVMQAAVRDPRKSLLTAASDRSNDAT
jgi:hypothetical protein